MAGLFDFLSGMMGNGSAPYEKYGDIFSNYMNKGQGYQLPFYNAGTNAIGQYGDWLNGQKDPGSFINNIMSQYKESPWARYQTQQGQRAATNMGSASGMGGSTPMAQFAAKQAEDISGQDMQSYLQNALGVNTQYGQGLGNLMTGGQNSGNMLSQMMSQMAQGMGGAAFGAQAGKQQDMASMLSGILGMLFPGGAAGMFL
jgi:hypothetical protein